ncbi:MAG: hypothetical protein MUP66_00550 [Candidatus Nanohaloarchaeota archaeon QJJ-5]|nr:hypothetical protein [Candidatus Nanohaloarchaeota archaeon QJJ-5]
MDDDEKDISEIADEVNEMAAKYRNGPQQADSFLLKPIKYGGLYLLTILPLFSLSYLVYAHHYTGWQYPYTYEPYTSIGLIVIGLVLTLVLYRFFNDDEEDQAYVPGPGESLDL